MGNHNLETLHYQNNNNYHDIVRVVTNSQCLSTLPCLSTLRAVSESKQEYKNITVTMIISISAESSIVIIVHDYCTCSKLAYKQRLHILPMHAFTLCFCMKFIQ